MFATGKWLVCVVTVILAWSEADAFPSVWKRDATSLSNTVPGICNSSICQQDATEILESLDKSVDPCDDFYTFACGGWKEKHRATNDKPIVNNIKLSLKTIMSQVELTLQEPISEDDISPLKAAKKMYQVCMDVKAIQRAGFLPLVDISKEFGGWPMAVEHWNEENFSVENALAVVYRYLAKPPLIKITAKISLNNNSSRALYIAAPDCESRWCRRSILNNDKKRVKKEGTIANASFDVMNSTGVHIDEESVRQQAMQVTDFMINRDNIRFFDILGPHRMTLKELQEWTDSALVANTYSRFNWLSYLNKILSDTDIVLDENEEVYVESKTYLFELVKLLDDTPRRVLANYLQWKIIEEQKNTLEKLSQDPSVGSVGVESRSTHCSQETFNRFRLVLSSHLARTIYSDEDKAHFETMVENLRSEFAKKMSNVDWLDDDKLMGPMFLKKVESLKVYSGYPDIYTNESALVEYYKQVHVGNNHIINMLLPPKHIRDMLPSLRKRVNDVEEQWNKNNLEDASAFYEENINAMFVPFGSLQQFQFKVGRLETLNYGRIGIKAGHEITFAILSAYRYGWWTYHTQEFLMARGRCFIDQYNRYYTTVIVPFRNTKERAYFHVNGERTFVDNLADNTAINAAYEAYQKYIEHHGKEQRLPGLEEYSPNQLFFIGYATSMCDSKTNEQLRNQNSNDFTPPEFARVRGSVSNMEQFATAFNCPAGSNMNPVNKCRIWKT